MQTFRLAALALSAALATSAQAASFDFDILYFGNNVATVAMGSTDPQGQVIADGDSFTWSITAQFGAEWQVQTTRDYFPLMAFTALGCGTRTGDWTLTLSNNGASVYSQSASGDVQRCVHMGTNGITLNSGLVFDKMHLSYTLATYVPDNVDDTAPNTINSRLPIFGAPEMNPFYPGIIYGPIPEPGTLAMLAAGLGMVGLMSRRRRSA